MTDTYTTARIPDEAVQVAHAEYHKVLGDKSRSNPMLAALTAALPHLSAPCAVVVKKLEWKEHADLWHCAENTEYQITRWWSDEIRKQAGHFEVLELGEKQFGTIEEAKAAAQADFERRILSCVVTMPVAIPTKEERHANTARNLIINQTSTDLEDIINGHDPEQSILNNDVWDRLDKMACEIEALAKPVDVAAVRRQAFEEAAQLAEKLDTVFDSKVGSHAASGIRALSAEPAQGVPAAARDVLAERRRQLENEGFDARNDDINGRGQIATAAGCYILHDTHLGDELEIIWPWDFSWWKPTNRRRDLVKAGALILAEIERIDRAAPITEAGK